MNKEQLTQVRDALAPFTIYGAVGSRDIEVGAAKEALAIVDAALAQLAAARKDAERYKVLRKPNADIDVCIRDYDHGMTGAFRSFSGKELDKQCDAIAATKGTP